MAELGGRKSTMNCSPDHPISALEKANEDLISGSVAEILNDEKLLSQTFATNLVNGMKQSDGTVKALTVKQVADLLGHSTTQVTEMYYVKKDTTRLNGITNDFNL